MNDPGKRPQAPPKVDNLKQMLHYQDKAVVSRMLAKNSGGSVTLFAFDGGEGLSEHTAPFDALLIGVEGQAELQVGGAGYRLGESDTLLVPANVPHAINPTGPFKMLLVMIRGEKAVQPG